MSAPNFTTTLGSEGILLATINMPGRSMNVFSTDLMDSLEELLDQVASRADVRAVVISSGKSTFLAGADLEMVKGYTELADHSSDEQLHQTCGRLGRLFLRLESLGKPFVAAINGLALGGGLELALACHERIATGSAELQLGLPEIKLGLLPGAGGTQRLPRYIGTSEAFVLLLRGDPISAQRALELGLIGAIVAPDELLSRACARACELVQRPALALWNRPGWSLPPNPFNFASRDARTAIARHVGLSDEELAHYPAYQAIVDCVIGGWEKPLEAACEWEMRCFVRLIRDPVAGNMIRTLFLNRQRAAKLLPRSKMRAPLPVAIQGSGGSAARAHLPEPRIAVVDPVQLPRDGLLLTTSPTTEAWRNFAEIAWLRDTPNTLEAFHLNTGIWVSETTMHGRVVEICFREVDAREEKAALELAAALRATPLITPGESLLRNLDAACRATTDRAGPEERLLAVALAAADAWSKGSVPDTGLADTAAVLAGLHPAYTGGPFTYLHKRRAADLRQAVVRANAEYHLSLTIPAGFDDLCLPAAASR
jgi:3-hydroxyacyl-CoA dehydrogenase/enoyl-CoA hydratase/3-hydroxybutyryl-CoA epimerase